MVRQILQSIGLTRGESEVYLCLLKTGNTTSGALIKKSGVSRSKVYEVLERLKQKGLATEMIKHNIKYFEATSPNKVLEYVHSKKKEIEEQESLAEQAIPQLTKLQHEHQEKQEAKIYSGIEGWRTLYSEMIDSLQRGEEYIAFGISPTDYKSEQLQRVIKNFHLKRAEKKIKARILLYPEMKKIIDKQYEGMKHTEFRYIKTQFPTNINLHNDNVVTLVWGENPVAFLISSKQVKDKYKAYFELLWRQAKP